ncbi:hypothetical protein JCM11491_005565 [Sporobolomyces phaffii]
MSVLSGGEGATPRRLKRLSLNSSSFASSSPDSLLSFDTGTGTGTGQSPTALRTRAHTAPVSRESSTTPTRTVTPQRTSRRTSSISYAKSPTPSSSDASFEGPRPRLTPRTSLSLDTAEPDDVNDDERNDVTATEVHTPDAPLEDEPIPASALGTVNAAAAAAAAQQPPTLLEQNADLLSFIAKKERKCLDLREELKRHESELALLKRKWESIVARSFEQSRHAASHSVSTVSSASPNTSPTPRSAALHPAAAGASAHSLDLSLLSTTFDAADLVGTTHPSSGSGDARHRSALGSSDLQQQQLEIPESVKAAGTWLGGALGRVLEAAVGMPPPAEAPGDHEPLEGKRREREGPPAAAAAGTTNGMLESLQEEDEEDEGEDGPGTGAADERRGPTAASDGGRHAAEPKEPEATTDANSSVHDAAALKTSPLRRKPLPELGSSSTTPTPPRRLFTSSTALNASTSSSSSSPSSALAAPSTSPAHTRTRSSLASLTDSWSSLNKRWTDLTESDAFQSSKRATLGLVDTFEQGLAQALGPLEPPSLSTAPDEGDAEPTATTRRRTSIPSPYLGGRRNSPAGTEGGSATPERKLTEVPISPVPGQALSSVFASWNKGKGGSNSSSRDKREAAAVASGEGGPTTAPAQAKASSRRESNGFDWSAFQDERKEPGGGGDDGEGWPAW